jgi:hypothetical protein
MRRALARLYALDFDFEITERAGPAFRSANWRVARHYRLAMERVTHTYVHFAGRNFGSV